jgi:hypothetical protein
MARKKELKAPGWSKWAAQKSAESRSMPPALTAIPAPKPTKERKQAIRREADAVKLAAEQQTEKDKQQSNKEVVEDQKKKRAQP